MPVTHDGIFNPHLETFKGSCILMNIMNTFYTLKLIGWLKFIYTCLVDCRIAFKLHFRTEG